MVPFSPTGLILFYTERPEQGATDYYKSDNLNFGLLHQDELVCMFIIKSVIVL